MKLNIVTTALLPLALLSAAPSPTFASPSPEADSLHARSHHLALVRRERALLRPAMRPNPALMARHPKVGQVQASVPLPLRRQNLPAGTGSGSAKRRDGKMASRRKVAEFGPEGLAVRNLLLPLPMQVRAATAQESADLNNNASTSSTEDDEDPDFEDDWDCEEEDQSAETDTYTTDSYAATPYTPYTPSASTSSSEYTTPALTSSAVTVTSSTSPRPTPTETYLRPASHVEQVLIPTSLSSLAQSSEGSSSSSPSAPSSSSASASASDDNSTDTVVAVITQTDEAIFTATAAASTNPKLSSKSSSSSTPSSATSNGSNPKLTKPSSSAPQAVASVREASGLVDPSNLVEGSTTVAEGCTRFHTVLSGEVCLGIIDYSKDLDFTLEQLYAYNPAINDLCTNLNIGWGLCIGKSDDEIKTTETAQQQTQQVIAQVASTSTSTRPAKTDVTTKTLVVNITSTSTLPYVAPTAAAAAAQ